jgi:hypothetical protein
MHIAIDNAVSGHGAGIIRAVKLYLRQVRNEGGDPAVQCHWRRIWDGYVAFAYTFVIIIQQVIEIIKHPPTLEDRLHLLIRQKKPHAEFNHGRIAIAGRRINSWFSDPKGFLEALSKERRLIVPGKPDEGEFMKLFDFRGRMYHVFTEDEIKLWRDWILQLGGESGRPRKKPPAGGVAASDDADDARERADKAAALRSRLEAIDPILVPQLSDKALEGWQQAAADHRLALWTEIALSEADVRAKKALINARLEAWLGWGMIRAVTYIAAQHGKAFEHSRFSLRFAANENLMMSEWCDRIRAEPNSSVLARAFLRALEKELRKHNGEPERVFDTVLMRAFDSAVPGNDGRRAWDTLEAWIAAGYPLPKPDGRRVKPLRLDATLSEEECHPTGVTMGFGTVH